MKVLPHLAYWIYGSAMAVSLFLVILWGPAILFLWRLDAQQSEILGVAQEVLRLAFFDATTPLLAFYAIFSLLTGANAALLAYYWRTRSSIPGSGAGGALGAAIALLGFGCASCGTLFLTLVATSVGGGALAALPRGTDIGWALKGAGVALLSYSLILLVGRIKSPLVCPVD
jgi:hypothetical protein